MPSPTRAIRAIRLIVVVRWPREDNLLSNFEVLSLGITAYVLQKSPSLSASMLRSYSANKEATFLAMPF